MRWSLSVLVLAAIVLWVDALAGGGGVVPSAPALLEGHDWRAVGRRDPRGRPRGRAARPTITRRLIEQFVASARPPTSPDLHRLTERERDVLTLVAQGLSNAEIAEQLIVGIETIKTHVARVLDKLGVRDRVQAVIFAYESGLIRPE